MGEFKASNGIRRDFMEDLEEGLGYSFAEIDALAEFFQHKRDEELGRWRWPENPGYVVYRSPEADYGADRAVYVFNERSGEGRWCWEASNTSKSDALVLAAGAYFKAHPEPEPKPWHDAKPGEVWVLTVGGEQFPCTVEATGPDFVPLAHALWATLARGSERITAGRRIWPESPHGDT